MTGSYFQALAGLASAPDPLAADDVIAACIVRRAWIAHAIEQLGPPRLPPELLAALPF